MDTRQKSNRVTIYIFACLKYDIACKIPRHRPVTFLSVNVRPVIWNTRSHNTLIRHTILGRYNIILSQGIPSKHLLSDIEFLSPLITVKTCDGGHAGLIIVRSESEIDN